MVKAFAEAEVSIGRACPLRLVQDWKGVQPLRTLQHEDVDLMLHSSQRRPHFVVGAYGIRR